MFSLTTRKLGDSFSNLIYTFPSRCSNTPPRSLQIVNPTVSSSTTQSKTKERRKTKERERELNNVGKRREGELNSTRGGVEQYEREVR